MSLEHFPGGYEPRDAQRQVLQEIDGALASGYKRIVLSAPTGMGKSLIGVTLARRFGTSFIVTNSRHLQDQYTGDFGFIMPVKGKGNFACLKIMEAEGVKGDEAGAIKRGMTCNKGECVEKAGKGQKNCKFKPQIKEFEEGSFDGRVCPYYQQKYAGLIADHSIWNYASYFQVMRYNQKNYGHYLNKQAAIFDEAHKLEDQIVDFVGIDLYAGPMRECGIDASEYNLGSVDDILSILDAMSVYYARELRNLESSSRLDYERHASLEKKYESAVRARAEVENDPENFVINRPSTDPGGEFSSVSIKPLDISRYGGRFFRSPYQVFMSATISRNSFCEALGIDRSEVAYIDVPKSPFPAENRKVSFENTRALSYRSTAEDEAAVIGKIDEIMSEHAGQKGIILTSSKSRCYGIRDGLSGENRARITVCHAKNPDGRTQEEIMRAHAESRNGVLASSSLWEGVDLRGDLSRFQIIAKVPYMNYAENWVKRKKEAQPGWYSARAVMKVLQGMGRSVRGQDDWAKTYVLDSNVQWLLGRSAQMVPKAYHDVLGL